MLTFSITRSEHLVRPLCRHERSFSAVPFDHQVDSAPEVEIGNHRNAGSAPKQDRLYCFSPFSNAAIQSLACFCASAICAGVIIRAIKSRSLAAVALPFAAAMFHHLCAST